MHAPLNNVRRGTGAPHNPDNIPTVIDVLEPVKTMVGTALHIVHRLVQALHYLYHRPGCAPFHQREHLRSFFLRQCFWAARMIGRDKICAVVAAADARAMWAQVRRALNVTRTIELRLDWLLNDSEIAKFLALLRPASRRAPREPHSSPLAGGARRAANSPDQSRSNSFTWPRQSAPAAPGTTSKSKPRRCARPNCWTCCWAKAAKSPPPTFFSAHPKNLRRVAADLARAQPAAYQDCGAVRLIGASYECAAAWRADAAT